MKPYSVGDTVWLSRYDHEAVQKPCPICFGNKQVTLILGNDDKVLLPCDSCGHGLDEPTGVVTQYEYVPKAERLVITQVETTHTMEGEERRYYFAHRYTDPENIFDSEEEALARCNQMIYQERLEDAKAYRLKHNLLKSYAWNAGYHLTQARDCRKRAEYHDQKAILCKSRARNQEMETK